MRLNVLRRPAAKNNGETGKAYNIEQIRMKILFRNLICFLIVTFSLFFVSLPGIIEQNDWGITFIFIIIIIWMLAVAFIPKISFSFKTGSFIFVGELLGLVCLFTNGLFGSGIIILLAIPMIAGMLVKAQKSLLVFSITLIAFMSTIFLMERGVIPYPSWTLSLEEPIMSTWLISGLDLALIGGVCVYSLLTVTRKLEISVTNEKNLEATFEVERAKQDHLFLQTTQEQEHRYKQIRSALDISYAIGSEFKLDQLLNKTINLIQDSFSYYFVGIYLVDDLEEFANLKAGTGDAGKAMIEAGHRFAINDTSGVGWSIVRHQPKVAIDVGFEAVRFDNPLLSLTRSELVLPLILNMGDRISGVEDNSIEKGGQQVLGAMTIQSSDAKAFSQDDVVILQEISDALAAKLGYLILIDQLEDKLEESQNLNRQYLQEAWKEISREREENDIAFSLRGNALSDSNPDVASSEYSFPLILRDQEIGQLTFEFENAELKDDERALIEAVTNQAAVALENARLMERNQRQAGYERLLSDISRKVSSSTDLDTILQITLREIGHIMDASDGMLQLKIPFDEEET